MSSIPYRVPRFAIAFIWLASGLGLFYFEETFSTWTFESFMFTLIGIALVLPLWYGMQRLAARNAGNEEVQAAGDPLDEIEKEPAPKAAPAPQPAVVPQRAVVPQPTEKENVFLVPMRLKLTIDKEVFMPIQAFKIENKDIKSATLSLTEEEQKAGA